jgi:quinoprotein glucose dehydrogenase
VQEVSQAKAPVKYRISGYTKFLDADGYPAVKPPWGTLNAIDLNTGEYVWKTTFGEHPALAAKGVAQTGAESYGGPVVTASGLLFIAGTADGKFRVYDKKTGKAALADPAPGGGLCHAQHLPGERPPVRGRSLRRHQARRQKGDSYVAFAVE